MRFRRYINESDEIVEEIQNFLLENCQPVLKDFQRRDSAKLPYIGKRDVVTYEVKKPRKHRRPKDTFPEVHSFFDYELYKRFNIWARSQCIFTTGNKNMASNYGPVSVVLPIGEYEIIWNPQIEDLWTHLEDHWDVVNYIMDDFENIGDQIWFGIDSDYPEEDDEEREQRFEVRLEEWKEGAREMIDEILRDYKRGNIIEAVYSGHEIMLDCDEYVLINNKYDIDIINWMNSL